MSDRKDALVSVVGVAEGVVEAAQLVEALHEGVAQAAQVGIVRGAVKQLTNHHAPTPLGAMICGLKDGLNGVDNSVSHTKEAAKGAVLVVGASTASAAMAGAGALTGYAGMASAVSTLGLGSASTALASVVGITAASGAPLAGAAATTALTAAVGGPLVAGVLVVGAATAVGYGGYKALNWLAGKVSQALSLALTTSDVSAPALAGCRDDSTSMDDIRKYPRPSVTVDLVVFTVLGGGLQVLLIRRGQEPWAGYWALPGGFVRVGEEVGPRQGEDLLEAAQRELEEETGIPAREVYLEQLGAYGKPGRDPRGRIITIAYLALVRPDLALQAGGDASHVQWQPLEDSLAEGLAFDHGQILVDARKRLVELVGSTDLARNLLPERFTVADYREVFEAILGRGLDPGNFRRQEFGKLEASGVLLSARGTRHTGTRPARLYRFKS